MAVRSIFVLFTIGAAIFAGAARGDEYLDRWTPGGDTNVFDLPYRHRYASYERETDADWRDDRWQRTDKGPFLTHSMPMPGYETGTKVLAVQAGPGKFLLYDLSAGSFVAGVTVGELRIDPARFGLLNNPQFLGDVAFHVPAKELWRTAKNEGAQRVIAPVDVSKCDYRGLYLHGDRVLLVNQIDSVEVLETAVPNAESGIVTRELEVAPRDFELRLTLAKAARRPVSGALGRFVEWTDKTGQRRRAVLDAASQGVRLSIDTGKVVLHFPESTASTNARVSYAKGTLPRPKLEPLGSYDGPGLPALKQPGPPRWGEPLVTVGELAAETDAALVVDHITVPHENPFGALFFIAGLGFFANGDAALCTAHGDVWIVHGLDEKLEHVTWQRFATGLYQSLGLEIVDDQVYVLGRDQITRLHDNNHDGEADFYESFNNDLIDQGQPHAYAMRLDRAPDGSFLFLKSGEPPHGSALLRVSPDGQQLDVLARGFRHPFGLGIGPHGEITVADNEGNWVPSSKIDLIAPDGFYGFLGSAKEAGAAPPPVRPLCYVPKVVDNSSGGQFWNTSAKWTDYHRNEMFHFSWGRCTMHAVLRQPVGGTQQAATVQVPGVEFVSGPAEAAFHPRDGQLYVVGLNGWQTAATADGSFDRVRSTGKPIRLPSSFAAYEDGIELKFAAPLDPVAALDVASYQLEQWNYRWGGTYGSFHYCVADPKRIGHDKVPVEQATLSPDGKRLFLKTAPLQPVDQLHIAIDTQASNGESMKCDLYATIHALAPSEAAAPVSELLAKDNLLAWCIVPFDAKRRGPEERAVMLKELGIRKIAYDWREEHIPTFDEELAAYARHGITLHAFWTPVGTDAPLSEPHWPVILDLIDRHKVTPELWVMLGENLLDPLPEADRAQRAADILAPVLKAAAERNCRIGLYNHGGWFGEPDNQIRIIEALRAMKLENVGIVYNFHHGHEHAAAFPELAKRMTPHLMSVNVSGIRAEGPKILPFGSGDQELKMLQALEDAGYHGPIGILGHRDAVDARQSLQENLDGIERLRGGP
ncbi:MAG: DUF6797 domain-containing protein [Pirellulales bacterium]